MVFYSPSFFYLHYIFGGRNGVLALGFLFSWINIFWIGPGTDQYPTRTHQN